MRKLIWMVVPAAFLSAASLIAQQPSSVPAGTYTTTITKRDLPKTMPAAEADSTAGAWAITMDGADHFTVTFNGKQVVAGAFTTKGKRVTFDANDTGVYACHMPATYTYAVVKSGLKFTRVADKCMGRSVVLGKHTLKHGS